MSDLGISAKHIDMPLTKFICKLMKMNQQQRLDADPAKAAEGYGLPIETTTYWIKEARRINDVWPIRGGKK